MKGLGMDLCAVERMEKILEGGDRFLQRFYTPEERDYLAGRGKAAAESAAAMFAAKEAFLKAIGTGLSGVPMTDIGVTHEASGQPRYALGQLARAQLERLGATQAFLSLSHEAGMAAAVCVIE